MKIVCGWCAAVAEPPSCRRCGRDPAIPWLQRGQTPPVAPDMGRKPLDRAQTERAYYAAVKELTAAGKTPTIENLAEQLDKSPRTVREWRQKFGLV